MPASLLSPLMVWLLLLPPGSGIGVAPGHNPASPSTLVHSTSKCIDHAPVATISAWLSESDWEWQISEADTAEEESGEGDNPCRALEAFRSARPQRDPGIPSAMRRIRVMAPAGIRSTILRC